MFHLCPTEIAAVGALITGCASILHLAKHCKHRVCRFLKNEGGAKAKQTVYSQHTETQGDRK